MYDNATESDARRGVKIFSPGDRQALLPLLYFWDFYVSGGQNLKYDNSQLETIGIKVS